MILINMEMPENCWKCPMANTYSGYGPLQGCFAVQGKEYACIDEPYDTHYRPSWCPLTEQKTGKWLRTPTAWVYCSVCGREPPNETNATTPFCPNCGARMTHECYHADGDCIHDNCDTCPNLCEVNEDG